MADGELAGVDTLVLARWIAAVCQGIAVQSRSGASRADLHAVAEWRWRVGPDREEID